MKYVKKKDCKPLMERVQKVFNLEEMDFERFHDYASEIGLEALKLSVEDYEFWKNMFKTGLYPDENMKTSLMD